MESLWFRSDDRPPLLKAEECDGREVFVQRGDSFVPAYTVVDPETGVVYVQPQVD